MPAVRLTQNISGRFESRWSRVQIEASSSLLLKGMEGAKLGVWVAHSEGKLVLKYMTVIIIAYVCIELAPTHFSISVY